MTAVALDRFRRHLHAMARIIKSNVNILYLINQDFTHWHGQRFGFASVDVKEAYPSLQAILLKPNLC